MGAYVEHSFKRGFILDEEKIRRIKDSLEARLSKRPKPLLPNYKVYRGDSYSYTTQTIDEVIREDNEDWRRITRLDILVEEKDQLELRLSFHAKGADLNIIGDDRDEVFLLFSDIRDYVQNEVAVARGVDRNLSRAAFPLFILAMSLVMLLGVSLSRYDPQSIDRARASTDTLTKLNFLIDNAERAEPGNWLWFIIFIFGLLPVIIMTGMLEKASRYLFPSNVFVFGKQRQVFERRQRMRGNLFWVGVVGLIVSVVAGLLVWYATMPG